MEYKLSYQLEVYPNYNGLIDAVSTIHWTYTATDETFSAARYGALGLPAPQHEKYVTFDSLEDADIQNWFESNINILHLQQELADEIELQRNPVTVFKKLQWQLVEEEQERMKQQAFVESMNKAETPAGVINSETV